MCNFTVQIVFFIFSFVSLPTHPGALHAVPLWGIAAQLRCSKSPPLESLVPPKVPMAEPSPQQQHAACQVMLLTQSTQSLSPLPPHFPWQEEHHSNTVCTGRASIPVPEPVLSTQTQRKIRLGLLHTLCGSATGGQGPCPQHEICHPAPSSGISMPDSGWGKRGAHYNALHDKASN